MHQPNLTFRVPILNRNKRSPQFVTIPTNPPLLTGVGADTTRIMADRVNRVRPAAYLPAPAGNEGGGAKRNIVVGVLTLLAVVGIVVGVVLLGTAGGDSDDKDPDQ